MAGSALSLDSSLFCVNDDLMFKAVGMPNDVVMPKDVVMSSILCLILSCIQAKAIVKCSPHLTKRVADAKESRDLK